MKFHDQTKFGRKEGDCFNSCLASIINLPPDHIPFFMWTEDWYERLTEWLKGLGYYPMQFEINETTLENMSHYGVYILSGKSPRSDVPYPACLHAVLACGDEIIHDPHPSRDNLESYDDFIIIVKGINE